MKHTAICYQCKKDFPTEGNEPGTTVECPHCKTKLTITKRKTALTDRLFTRRHYDK